MLNTESLLRPIREDAPAGDNLRDDPSPTSPYYQIKDARNAARAVERAAQTSDDPDNAPAGDWEPILELGPKVLEETSKDLEVAAWMVEALVREEGFRGLGEGFDLTRELVENFWEALYPQPDEDGVPTRVAPLTGLNGEDAEGTLIVPIGMVPLLYDPNGRPLSAWTYRSATEVSAIADPEVKQRRIDAGAHTLDDFQRAVTESDPSELLGTVTEIEECIQKFAALSSALDERCGTDAPPASNIRNALEAALDCIRFLTKDLVQVEEVSEEGGAGGDGSPQSRQGSAPGVVASRQDAVEAMKRVRDYYRKEEPHSPISYLMDQALRWTQMPLHLLINEVIADPTALSDFQLRTGMPTGDETHDNES